jgi:hypothetical protein
MMSAADGFEKLSAAEIDGVATLWRRERREFTTSFNGSSMLPAIAPGQAVTVACGVEPMVGDVAVFRCGDQVGVHRVVAGTAAWLLTWGDNNPLPDEPIAPALVIGVISNVAPARHALRRKLLLRFLVSSRQQSIDLLTQRVRRVYRLRSVWGQGPLVIADTALRALLRRISPN